MKKLFWIFLLAIMITPAGVSFSQSSERPQLTLEDLEASGKFYGNFFQGGNWTDEGPVVTYIDRSGDLMSYNLETDTRSVLIAGTSLMAGDVNRVIAVQGYEWSKDKKKMLLYTDSERVWRSNTKGYYYILDLDSGKLTSISDRAEGFQMFAKMNAAGDAVAFVRNRDIFVVDLNSMEERQLTSNGSDGGIINGTFDWVYEEEFGLQDGWSWSPDGKNIAFFQLDESETHDFAYSDLRGQYPEVIQFRYPKAGEKNSEVHIGVIEVASGKTTFFDTQTWHAGGDETEYIARMGWTPEIDGSSKVWMFRLNRDQNELDMMYGNPANGEVKTVMHESESTWIDVESNKLTWLGDDEHFVWRTENDGWSHLYLYENDGTLVRQMTKGNWEVTAFHGVDESNNLVYFTATIDGSTERHLYSVPLNGDSSNPIKITAEAGTHNIDMSSDLSYYIDTYSSVQTPPVTKLHNADGSVAKVLEANEGLISLMKTYDLPKPEFMTVPAADGTELNAYMIKPSDFDPNKKYRLLIHTYGGPGSQEVKNNWDYIERLWHTYLAEEYDIIVAGVDNRGTGGRGKYFKSQTYKKLGILEAEDQIAAAVHFGAMDYIDENRMGIWGWSYGGYLSLMSMLYENGPQVYKLGMAVAPVTNWRQYDTIYTERFLSTPQKNAHGYDYGAPSSLAGNLTSDQKLLIVHGDMDDNVHFQNTIQMINALQTNNKQFSMMVYPGKNHGIYGGYTRLHLFTMLTNYLVDNL